MRRPCVAAWRRIACYACLMDKRRPLYILHKPLEWFGDNEVPPLEDATPDNLLLQLVQQELLAPLGLEASRTAGNGNHKRDDNRQKPLVKAGDRSERNSGQGRRGQGSRKRGRQENP